MLKQTHPNLDSLSSQLYDALKSDTGCGVFLEKVPNKVVVIDEGVLACAVVHDGVKYLVYNFHPLRKRWQQVYSLKHCDVDKQLIESIESLKRLFAKE